MKNIIWRCLKALPVLLLVFTLPAQASTGQMPDLTGNPLSWAIIASFVVAYVGIIWGEQHELSKFIPVSIGAGMIWFFVSIVYHTVEDPELIKLMEEGFGHSMSETGQLLVFLIVAMTYVVTMEERRVFEVIRYRLLNAGLSQRKIFWVTGGLAFCLSPFLDNLTTALALASVVIAVGNATRDREFVVLSAINIVVAANAGGAFSPFGDITTLMVWQAGKVDFIEFYSIFIPSLVNWLIPALMMSFFVKQSMAEGKNELVRLKRGALVVVFLFGITIALAVSAHVFLELPPVIGMITGIGLLGLYGYFFLTRHEHKHWQPPVLPHDLSSEHRKHLEEHYKPKHKPFNPIISVKRAEWDTLLFFVGILTAVAGLAQVGFLFRVSEYMYGTIGATWTNIAVGILSSVVDNIPVMSAVLQMNPDMVHGQWMLVTLTAGVGGSLLSLGSAAGVALMGAARILDNDGNEVRVYTFMSHLRWTPVIALGYGASIWVHTLLHAMS
ncbi:sodium:proton antiporter NhaD [Candidatus Kaiserbacteria bacterium]|nr:sodium:proton antiporter NhaD [Candidatus Kaiserbacteria bacterium]